MFRYSCQNHVGSFLSPEFHLCYLLFYYHDKQHGQDNIEKERFIYLIHLEGLRVRDGSKQQALWQEQRLYAHILNHKQEATRANRKLHKDFKPGPDDTLSLARPDFISITKQQYQLGIKYSNVSAYGGYSHLNCYTVHWSSYLFYDNITKTLQYSLKLYIGIFQHCLLEF